MLTPIPPNSFVNELIEISRDRSNEIRIQKELERENREKRKKEEYDKMMISITNIYYDKLKELFKNTAQDGKNTVKFTFLQSGFITLKLSSNLHSSKILKLSSEQLKIDWYNSCSIPTWYPDNVMLVKKFKNIQMHIFVFEGLKKPKNPITKPRA